MAYIKTMKDANGNIVYPQTHVRAVYTADGETLETKLNNLPTKVSELENDAGFITSTVDNLTNYYKKTETYTQDEVKDLINAITTLNIEVVAEKPTENISTTTIYLIGTDTEADNDFEEWIYTNGNWELIGTTAIDLTPYATKEYVNTQFTENQADWNETNTAAASYIKNKTHYELPYGPDLFYGMATYDGDTTSVSLPAGYSGYGGAANLVVIAQNAQGEIVQETLSRKDNANYSVIQAKREQYGNRTYYYGNLKLGADYFSGTHTFTSTEDTGENFFLFDPGYEVSTLYLVSANSFRKVSVHNPAEASIKKLDNKFLDIANIKTSELNNDANFINEETVNTKINAISTVKDWNENDPTAASYIKNRTHYEGGLVKTQWFSSPITLNEWRDYTSYYDSAQAEGLKILFFDDNYSLDDSGELEIDKSQYYFSIDGKDYVLPFTTEPPYDIYLGVPWKGYGEWNASNFENSQCPISIYFHRASGTSGPQLFICYNPEYVDLTNSILEIGYAETGIVTIDKKFLGLDKINLSELNNDTGFITKDVKDLVAYYDVSETYNKEEIDNFLYEYYTKNEIDDKNFADGDIYKNNQILMGAYFPATYNEGNIAALGASTHPYGYGTTTMRWASTAHGYAATAMGKEATATGDYSVAMGDRTETVGEGAFATGSMTRAEGRYSMAAGQESIAGSDYSHAEGLGTIALRVGQHTEGMYNISEEVINEDDIYNTGNLLHIIGNGTADDARSNAHTLDINGNAWFSGDVYVGSTSGTNKDEGSKKLATEEYVNNTLANTIQIVDLQPYEPISES